MAKKKLNLGCGNDIRSGWINLDSSALPGVDVVHNIERVPLPFTDGMFQEILCQDVLEHIDYIPVLKDLHRILEPGGILRIRVPHFTSRNNFVDPTHKKQFSVSTFSYFTQNEQDTKSAERQYYFDFHFSRIVSVELTFDRWSRLFLLNRLVGPIVNRNRRFQMLYEASGWSRLFPAQNILVSIVK